jgi:hypothetical protein
MRPTEIEATKRHIAAWDLSPEQVRELQRLADHLLTERERLLELLRLALQGIDIATEAKLPEFTAFVLTGDRIRHALAESEAR